MAMWNLDTSCEFVAGLAKLFGVSFFLCEKYEFGQKHYSSNKQWATNL